MNKIEMPTQRIRHTVNLLQEDGFGLRGEKIDFIQLISMNPNQAQILLEQRLAHQIAGLAILNKDDPSGVFNRHDIVHIRGVNRLAHGLLTELEKQSGEQVTNEQRNIATAISYLHDLGNNLSRRLHGGLSVRLLDKLFVNFDPNSRFGRSVIMGIYAHDEPFGSSIYDYRELIDSDDNVEWAPVLAVAIADKLDVGRHRLSTNLARIEGDDFRRVVEEVPHTLVSLYARDNRFYFESSTSANWKIDFSSVIFGDEGVDEEAILRKFVWKGNDLYVPREWHDKWKSSQRIPYSASYFGHMRMLYCERIAIMLSALYAMFPKLEQMSIVVEDNRPFIRYKQELILPRDEWQQVIFADWKRLHQEKYRNRLISVPKILSIGEREYQLSKGVSREENGEIE